MAVLALDIGGTKTIVAAVEGSKIGRRRKFATPKKADDLLSQLAETIEASLAEAGSDIKGIGIALAGLVDYNSGLIISSPNLPLDGCNLNEELQGRTGLAVFTDNDANLAALGEAIAGAGRDWEDFIALTLGTGIGGGIINNKQIYHGYLGTAAEIGHMVIAADGPLCQCGRRGCWEALASGTALSRSALDLKKEKPNSRLSREIAADNRAPSLTAGDLARRGDPDAIGVYQAMGRYLGIGLGNLINILSPRGIIIGGGLAAAADLFLSAAREAMARTAIDPRAGQVELRVSELGYDAGLLGAAALATAALDGGGKTV